MDYSNARATNDYTTKQDLWQISLSSFIRRKTHRKMGFQSTVYLYQMVVLPLPVLRISSKLRREQQ